MKGRGGASHSLLGVMGSRGLRTQDEWAQGPPGIIKEKYEKEMGDKFMIISIRRSVRTAKSRTASGVRERKETPKNSRSNHE